MKVKRDVSKLPKWVREKLAKHEDAVEVLEANIDYWRKRAFQAAGARPTNTMLYGVTVDDMPSGLPENSQIKFALGKDAGSDEIVASIQDIPGLGHVLVVNAIDGLLVAMPRAANMLYVKVTQR